MDTLTLAFVSKWPKIFDQVRIICVLLLLVLSVLLLLVVVVILVLLIILFYDFLKNYLSDRSQVVRLHNQLPFSNTLPFRAGVPTGYILSPLLFYLFINDFTAAVAKCLQFQYADDTVLLSKHVCYTKPLSLLQDSVYEAASWFMDNCLVINQKKTKLFSLKNALKAMVTNAFLLLDARDCASCKCTPIEYVNSNILVCFSIATCPGMIIWLTFVTDYEKSRGYSSILDPLHPPILK